MYQPFNSQDSVLLLIDHQVGTMGWVGSTSFDTMKKNALLLAKTAATIGIPTVLTSSGILCAAAGTTHTANCNTPRSNT